MKVDIQVNKALCASPQQREEMRSTPGLVESIKPHWNGGKICGQCKSFSHLGKEPGLNGICSSIEKRDYTAPSDKACRYFEIRHA